MPHSDYESVQFDSRDGLCVTADHYPAADATDLIVLCHRSHSNRGEHREAAPKLGALGFSCLALDQRSGMKVFGEVNETSALAKEKGLPTGYLDARQDIEAAVEYAHELNGGRPVILLGSSYSAALALLIAEGTDKVKAVAAFSPGEHLKGVDLAREISSLDKPVWATGAKKEIGDAVDALRFVDPDLVTLFMPEVDGFHGSKTLWESVEGHEVFWESLEEFLAENRASTT